MSEGSEEVSHIDALEKSVPGGGHIKRRGPGVEIC